MSIRISFGVPEDERISCALDKLAFWCCRTYIVIVALAQFYSNAYIDLLLKQENHSFCREDYLEIDVGFPK